MAENPRSAWFPHCVTSCFGIRKRQPHDERHSKVKDIEKLHGNVAEKPALENGIDACINGSRPQQPVNGKVCHSKSSDMEENTNRLPDPALIQPEKSTLPLLDECLNDTPDSNGHTTCENIMVIPEPKDTSGDCNILNSVLKEAQPMYSNKTEQSLKTDGKTEVSGQHSVGSVFNETSSPVPETMLCKSDASQAMPKEDNEITMSEEINDVHNDEGNKYHTHFRELLDTEKERLTNLVLEWSELLSTDINVEVQDEIRSVTGQTNLIITERFAQFSRLITRSEGKCQDNQSDGKAIMASDLQGFWDMILFQVKDVLNKFAKLERLRKSNWDLKHLNADISTKKTPKKKATVKNTTAADNEKEKARRLAARKRIAEARQRLRDQNQQTPEHGAIIL